MVFFSSFFSFPPVSGLGHISMVQWPVRVIFISLLRIAIRHCSAQHQPQLWAVASSFYRAYRTTHLSIPHNIYLLEEKKIYCCLFPM